ncbi:hypothetical protein FIT65_04515 [Candidatus Methylopumilus planktonicus]|nr:hypothetical protein FIT67_04495 [Candidatus Methylopumilus planktonicus]QDD09745.1 hypothetical protein FIT65_04515 [Candidatus Methylopumilus planktonicus]
MLNSLSLKKNLLLIFRHSMVSTVCGLSEFSLFLLLFSYLKFNLLASYVLSFSVATVIGFWGHSIFTFRLGQAYKKNAFFFIFQALSALSIGYFIVFLLIRSGIEPVFAKAFQLIIIFSFNVTFGKMVSFKKR